MNEVEQYLRAALADIERARCRADIEARIKALREMEKTEREAHGGFMSHVAGWFSASLAVVLATLLLQAGANGEGGPVVQGLCSIGVLLMAIPFVIAAVVGPITLLAGLADIVKWFLVGRALERQVVRLEAELRTRCGPG